jgi:hypothetical protein
MELNVDFLISFFKKNTKSLDKEEFSEQDAGAAPAGGSTGGGSGKTPKKWTSGLKDGPARGNISNPKHIWTTGRVIGKTGGSDFD